MRTLVNKIIMLVKFLFKFLKNRNKLKELQMFTTLSLINACLVNRADVFALVDKASTIRRKVELVFGALPADFKASLVRSESTSIDVFNELFTLIDADLNPRTIDRYRRMVSVPSTAA